MPYITLRRCLATALSLAAFAAPAIAQTPAPKPAPGWMDTISFGLQIQGGIAGNPTTSRKRNWGHLFTDTPNMPVLNQVLATIERKIDSKTAAWDVGFKLQGMYGSDARYTHLLGVFDRSLRGQYQFDLVEANVTVHAPILTAGGLDGKFGVFATPLGFETIDPSTNPFYTHSYIFNFGLPLKHTGALMTLHLTDQIDLIGGITTGVNTSLGKYGDNNSSVSAIFGAIVTLLDGDLVINGATHVGAENPRRTVANAGQFKRWFNDVYVTWKATDKLTFITELNYVREEGPVKAEAMGIAQYVSYALNEKVTLNARGEVFRDGQGFFVAAFPGHLDAVNAQTRGVSGAIPGTKTTYGAITAGVSYKPEPFGPLSALTLRPEVRYDTTLGGTKPFNGGRSSSAVMLSMDAIVAF